MTNKDEQKTLEILRGLTIESDRLIRRLERHYDSQLFPDFRVKLALVRARARARRRHVRLLSSLDWY